MLHKVEDKRKLAKQIQDYLDKSPEVRPFPAAVTRLLSAIQDVNADCRSFESIIETDAGLSVHILRLANSPLFCTSGKVNSIAHAVSLLGMRKLKSLAISAAGASMFKSGSSSEEQRQQLWHHSVGCAVVARKLAEHVPNVNADDAFLAGVFHDVGKLLFYDVVPDEYAEIEASSNGLLEEEERVMGTTHEQIGLSSAHSWDLPKEIKSAIGWHHRPEQALAFPEMADTIYLANRLARFWGIGSEESSNEEVLTEAHGKLGLTEEQINEMEIAVVKDFEETL